MADFSRFSSAPATEWTEFEKTWKRPARSIDATLTEIRDATNIRNASVFADVLGRPTSGLDVSDHHVVSEYGEEFSIRLYRPAVVVDEKAPTLPFPLYISFHGGGYHLGNLETEDPHCRQVALQTGLAVLNVNYRHTPEWIFPAPVTDAWAAYEWVLRNASVYGLDKERIFVGGVSAGATLSIAVALRALRSGSVPRVKGLILGTPSTVHADRFPLKLLAAGHQSSLITNANSPFLGLAQLCALANLYQPDPDHPDCSPLLIPAEEFTGLCPVSFHIAGLDPLRDEGLLFEDKLRGVGVTTTLHEYPGIPHAFMSLPSLPSAKRWRQEVYKQLRAWSVPQ